MIAQNLSSSDWVKAAAAIAVIVGHIFPVWLGFRGGKGVATGVGVFLVLAPIALLCAGVIFVSIVFFTRYVSLGSIMAAALIPFVRLVAECICRARRGFATVADGCGDRRTADHRCTPREY